MLVHNCEGTLKRMVLRLWEGRGTTDNDEYGGGGFHDGEMYALEYLVSISGMN